MVVLGHHQNNWNDIRDGVSFRGCMKQVGFVRHGCRKGKEVMLLIGTLENVRLREGDRVMVLLSSGIHQVEVVDSSDQSKIRVRLDTGTKLWIGRRAILDVLTD